MIHGLLLVLKFLIGILLGLLGLLLGILLFVLLCAVRYQAYLRRKDGRLTVQVRIRFFLAGTFCFSYQAGTADARLRILRFSVWNSGSSARESTPPKAPDAASKRRETPPKSSDVPPERKGTLPQKQEAPPQTPEAALEPAGALPEQRSTSAAEAGLSSEKKERKGEKGAFWKKGVRKVRFAFQSFCDRIKQAEDGFLWLTGKWAQIRAFWEEPANRRSVRLLTAQARKLAVYVLPRTGVGELTFGLEDPYRMGELLSLAAFVYPLSHQAVVLHPVFDQDILEGEAHLGGRFRPGVILFFAARILLDSNIRRWIARLTRDQI